MSEIEKAFGGDLQYLCKYWERHTYAGDFIFGSMCVSHGDLRYELFWLHQIWFIKGGYDTTI